MDLFRNKKENCNPRQTSGSKTIGKLVGLEGWGREAGFLRGNGVRWNGCCQLKSTGVTWEFQGGGFSLAETLPVGSGNEGNASFSGWSSRVVSMHQAKSVSSCRVCN